MDVMDAIKLRRSVRKYSSKPIEEEKLNAVLEAARLAPSASNFQGWRFVAVTDKEKITRLKEACGDQEQVGMAPAVIVVCETYHRMMACGQPAETIDASIAMSFMLLEAREQGLGTCWIGLFYEDKVKAVLDIPDDVSVVAVTPLGYPDDEPPARPRKTFSEVISYNKY
ncbi:MAG TPA: nitroreductase family protein [Ruminiclostridium sp.]|nr:nitroreductase family protein [Ruminiclostridium sp.]